MSTSGVGTDVMESILLLQRSDTDVSLKDIEGYTAFDLYNSTVHGTKPSDGEGPTELFTWGANRFVNDRTFLKLTLTF